MRMSTACSTVMLGATTILMMTLLILLLTPTVVVQVNAFGMVSIQSPRSSSQGAGSVTRTSSSSSSSSRLEAPERRPLAFWTTPQQQQQQQQQPSTMCFTSALFAKSSSMDDDEIAEPGEEDLIDLPEDVLDDLDSDEEEEEENDNEDLMMMEDEDVDDDDDDEDDDEDTVKMKDDDEDEDEGIEEEDDALDDVALWEDDEEVEQVLSKKFKLDEVADEEEEGTNELYNEAEDADDDWQDYAEYEDVPLGDDGTDPDYTAQKKLVEETVARRMALDEDNNFDALKYATQMSEEQRKDFKELEMMKEFEQMYNERQQDRQAELEAMTEDLEKDADDNGGRDEVLEMDYDPDKDETGFPLPEGVGVSAENMKRSSEWYKQIQDALDTKDPDGVQGLAQDFDWSSLSNETMDEIEACLGEIEGAAYNMTEWLLYDLNYNVSNLFLAAVQHNPDAPIFPAHWYPQLVTYKRYQHARDRDFDYTETDVENADITELQRYYKGFGYDEIPNKAPGETGVIGFGEMDEDEIRMADFDHWIGQVYNPETFNLDFDNDDFESEDNVFSDDYVERQHPDFPSYEDAQSDLAAWREEMGDNETTNEYRDFMGVERFFDFEDDKEFEKEFRGHLIIACGGFEGEPDICEKITLRCQEEFGKAVYVETQVVSGVKEEDNVFEIWLESYEVELLHSRKKALAQDENWEFPAVCDDAEIERIVEEVRFQISDLSRYSYRFKEEFIA